MKTKITPTVTLSLDHYGDVIERLVFDALLDNEKRPHVVKAFLAEAMSLRQNLVELKYPKMNEMLMAFSVADPAKIKKCHEQFNEWAKNCHDERKAVVQNSLLESRAYLYGREVEFSKDMAERIVESIYKESEANLKQIVGLIEQAIARIPNWHGSTVIFKALKPDDELVSNEGLVIIGQPPSLTFMCRNTPVKLEVYDVQDIDGYALSVQEDYSALARMLHSGNRPKSFTTGYVVADRQDSRKLEGIKRELALGYESVLPVGMVMEEELPDVWDRDIWKVKLKPSKLLKEINETPLRWLERVRNGNEVT